MEAFLADLLTWVHAHPHWAGVFVLTVSALESLLVIGLFVPGTVVMFGIGTMIAAGSMELLPTLVWAAVGAVLGDGSSYLIGRHYHQHLRVMWPFRKYPGMITRGVDFFHSHGGKGVILARFIGPVRPLLPAVAGMLDMPAQRFFLVNSLSAVLWAPAYILPGVLFGASLGVAAEIAGRLALLLAILVALLWFSWWLMSRLTRSLQPHARDIQLRLLDSARRHNYLYPLAAALLDPEHPEARGMTVLTVLLIIAGGVLLALMGNLSANGLPGNLNLYLFHQLQDLRSPLGDHLLVSLTELGSSPVLYGFALLLSAWLLWRRHWRITIHWVSVIAGVSVMTVALKTFTAVPRPPVPASSTLGYAFPSAHAGLSVAVFGFLAVAIARELRSNWHWLPYSVSVLLVVAIGFSRIYLGVHWFSDVLGGWSLGLAWVALMGIAYRQHPAESISARGFAAVALAALLLAASLYHTQRFEQDLALYQPEPVAEIALDSAQWQSTLWRSLPVYQDDLEGRHTHPLDIQWLASRQQIESQLLKHGWRHPPKAGSLSLLDLLNSDAKLKSLPVLPQVHRGETQQILLVRDTGKANRLLALRLWKTGYRQRSSGIPLWVGNVTDLVIDRHFRLLQFLRTDPDYHSALDDFMADIRELHTQRVQRKRPAAANAHTRWSGKVLLIGR